MSALPRRELLLVEWLDSRGGSSWTPVDELESSACHCWSAGWVVAADKATITLAGHIGSNPAQCCGEITIPRITILRSMPLELSKPKPARSAGRVEANSPAAAPPKPGRRGRAGN
jgi:hypothetical protein